jgi:hypothetical protein
VCLGSKDCVQKICKESISLRASSRIVKDIMILNGNVTVFRRAVLHCSNEAWVHNSPGVRLSWHSSWFYVCHNDGCRINIATVRLRVGEQCCYRTVAGWWEVLLPFGGGLAVVSLPYGCGMVSSVATVWFQVGSVATVRLWVGISVATVRLRVGNVASIRLRHGEECCYRTVAGWQWAVLLLYGCRLAGWLA